LCAEMDTVTALHAVRRPRASWRAIRCALGGVLRQRHDARRRRPQRGNPWNETLPLVGNLTARRIGQVWLDHTGHNTERQYGSSTKAWRFDAVGVMTPLPDDQRGRHEVAFTLSFEYPGKARRRTPDNW